MDSLLPCLCKFLRFVILQTEISEALKYVSDSARHGVVFL